MSFVPEDRSRWTRTSRAGPGPHPAVLVIPGGGGCSSTRRRTTGCPTQLAERGIAAFAIDYRPSTDAPFPAALEDAQAAVRFVRAHAARFHIDPARLGAVGGSSGRPSRGAPRHVGRGIDRRSALACGSRSPGRDRWTWRRSSTDPNPNVVYAVETFLGCSRRPPRAPTRPAPRRRSHTWIRATEPSTSRTAPTRSSRSTQARADGRRARAIRRRPRARPLGRRRHGLSSAASDKGFDPAFAFLDAWIDPDAATGVEPSPSPEKAGCVGPSVSRRRRRRQAWRRRRAEHDADG